MLDLYDELLVRRERRFHAFDGLEVHRTGRLFWPHIRANRHDWRIFA